jgi:hypothetical protein
MWGPPIDERVEFLSDDWLSSARRLLERRVLNPDLPHRIRAQGLSRQVSEIAENGYAVLI